MDDWGQNSAAEGFFRLVKRERINRPRYRNLDEALAEVLGHIQHTHKLMV